MAYTVYVFGESGVFVPGIYICMRNLHIVLTGIGMETEVGNDSEVYTSVSIYPGPTHCHPNSCCAKEGRSNSILREACKGVRSNRRGPTN